MVLRCSALYLQDHKGSFPRAMSDSRFIKNFDRAYAYTRA